MGRAPLLAGVAFVVVAYKADAEDEKSPTWPSGRPEFSWIVRGKRCYDPRKDSTVPGGDGPHRWDAPGTWEYTENPAVQRYNYARGIYACDRVGQPEQLLVGRGLSALEAPPERVVSAANVCAEIVGWKGGGGYYRYVAGGLVQASDPFIDVEEMFADVMAGEIVQREGGVEIEPGQAKAPAASITDLNLVVGEPVRFTPFLGDDQRVNTVIPRYVDPGQRWREHTAPIRRNTFDVAADGGVREETLTLALLPYAKQAQRCAEVRRRLNRLERRATITLSPRFGHLEEGDWIVWASERRTQGQPVTYRVESWVTGSDRRIRLDLREITPEVFAWDPANDEYTPGEAPPPSIPPLPPLTLLGVAITAASLGGVPALQAVWTAPVDAAVTAVRIEVRELGSADIASDVETEVNGGRLTTTNGVASAAALEARLVPLGGPGRRSTPSMWIPVTSEALIAAGVPWTGVTDPANTRPEDNATVGATVGTGGPGGSPGNLVRDLEGGGTAPVLLTDILNSLVTVDFTDELADLRGDVDDLVSGGLSVIFADIEQAFVRRGELSDDAYAGIGVFLDTLDEIEERKRLTYLDGEEVGSVVRHEQTRTDDVVETLDLTAVKTPDGGAVILQRDTVIFDPATGTTMAEQVELMESATGEAYAYAETVRQVATTALAAEAVTRTQQVAQLGSSVAAVDSRVTTVATDLSAEAQTRATQVSQVQDSIAGVDTRVTTTANALSAETTERTQAISTVAGNVAAVTTLANTTANALSAETQTRTTQISQVGQSIATVDGRVTTTANALSAETEARSTQTSTLGQNIATVDNRVTTVATDLSAETTVRTVQISAVQGSVAAVDQRVTTTANALSAETQTRTTQVSQVQDSIAGFDSRITTTANAISAETQTREQQISSVGQNIAGVDQRITTTANALSAETQTRQQQISAVEGSVAGFDSRIATASQNGQAAVETLTQMGATIGNGSAFQMDTSRVVAGPGELLSTRLNSVGAQLGSKLDGTQVDARVDTKISTAIQPGGTIAEYVTDVVADGPEAVAKFVISAQASGSLPARLAIVSANGSSNIALNAEELFFGDNTAFYNATDTFETLSNSRRYITGGPFGPDGLVQWLGPDAYNAWSATRANADFYVATTSPRIGGSDFPAGGSTVFTKRFAGSITPGAVGFIDFPNVPSFGFWTFTLGGVARGPGGSWSFSESAQDDSGSGTVANGEWRSAVTDGPEPISTSGTLSGGVRGTGPRRIRFGMDSFSGSATAVWTATFTPSA